MPMSDEIECIEPFGVPTVMVDGLTAIQVDRFGIARLIVYSEQLETDGSISHTVSARLTMRHAVMSEIGEKMMLSYSGMPPAVRRDPRFNKLT